MPKSVADLIAERAKRNGPVRPERILRVIVGEGQKYVVEAQRLTQEERDILLDIAEEAQRPKKMGATPEPPERLTEVRDRLAELNSLMGEYEGELTIRGTKTDGEWEQWRIEHPARDEDEPGYRDDLVLAGGACNTDALLADLAAYVVAWNGEPLPDGGYEALELLRPDKKQIAATVVGMYETGDDLPKWRGALSAHLKNEQSSN
jgi:hypothetical protein